MNATASLPEQDTEHRISMSDDVLVAIGAVLAAVVRFIHGQKMRHRGGPGISRRLASIIAAFIAFVVMLVLRQRAIAVRIIATVAASPTLRHLRRPPQGWAAP